MSKKIIAFSLWGDSPKYCVGAIKNAEIAQTIYPDWTCRFYIGKSTPQSYISQLISLKNTEVFIMKEPGNWVSTFWRFLAVDDYSTSIVLLRDTDSRISLREQAAVNEWISSDKAYHIMRDHPQHGTPILAGMWGVKKPIDINFYKSITSFPLQNYYGIDQEFLAKIVYPTAKNSSIVHDEFFDKKPFPIKRNGIEYVGQVFLEDDSTIKEHTDNFKKYFNI